MPHPITLQAGMTVWKEIFVHLVQSDTKQEFAHLQPAPATQTHAKATTSNKYLRSISRCVKLPFCDVW